MTKVNIIWEGNVPRWKRIRDRITVTLLFAGHPMAARLVLRLTGVTTARVFLKPSLKESAARLAVLREKLQANLDRLRAERTDD